LRVYKFVDRKDDQLVSVGVNSFVYELGTYTECEIKNNGSGIYCFYKHGVNGVWKKTKEEFILIELEVDENDLIRNEGEKVCVFRAVTPIRIVDRDEYETWR
jgi:transcriptional/translational regulatory protein YebC/TACO1